MLEINPAKKSLLCSKMGLMWQNPVHTLLISTTKNNLLNKEIN